MVFRRGVLQSSSGEGLLNELVVKAPKRSVFVRVLNSLQILRAIAATLVAYAHAHDLAGDLNAPNAYQSGFFYLERFGAVGVDMFFVISGIIIALTANEIRNSHEAHAFALKRVARVVPLYWLVSAGAISWAMLSADTSHPITASTLAATFLFYPVHAMPIVHIGWTLCFEMLFYLGMYLFQWGRFWAPSTRLLVVGILSVVTLGLVSEEAARTFFLNPLIIEFGLGVIIGVTYLQGHRLDRGNSLLALGLGVVLLCATLVFGYGRITEVPLILSSIASAERVALWGIPCALMVLGVLNLEQSISRDRFWILILLGDASYSIYLMHPVVYRGLRAVPGLSQLPPDLIILFATFAAVLGGWVAYHLLETPLLKLCRACIRGLAGNISPRTQLAEAPRARTDFTPIARRVQR
jgi:exopolysaccharide production protein ExoZ